MFRNRQPAWPYRCTGKDARTGVFFFALRAGAARAFPAAGHARGREAAASPAENTAAWRSSARGANRARPTSACTPRDGVGGGIPAGNTAARRKPARGADRARPTRARVPQSGAGSGTAGREHGGAAKAGARRRSCAPNPRVRPAGWHGRRHRRQRTRRRGESRCAAQTVRAQPARAPRGMARAAASPAENTAARPKFCARRKSCAQTLPDGAKRQSLAIITILNHISKHCQENRRCRAPAAHPTTAGCFNSNTRR